MRFLVDQCVGRRVATWLRGEGHDVLDASELRQDPGDRALLERARDEERILVTLDKDFGGLVYLHGMRHAGLIRLPDVPARRRIVLMAELLGRHGQALEAGAVVTIDGGRIRISRWPPLQ